MSGFDGDERTTPSEIEVRPLRLRDIIPAAADGARTMDEEAEGKLMPDGSRRLRLLRTRAMFPRHRPLRRGCLFVLNIVNEVAFKTWSARTPSEIAVVSSWRKTVGTWGRLGFWVRLLAVIVSAELLLAAIGFWLYSLSPFLVLAGSPPAILLAWLAVPAVKETRQMSVLEEAEKAIVAAARAKGREVYWASSLTSGNLGAGAMLAAVLVDVADARKVTLIARTEAGVLARLYQDAGFKVVAKADVFWGTAVLVRREPRPRPANKPLQSGTEKLFVQRRWLSRLRRAAEPRSPDEARR